jgi:murein DD-endopeptidase MepM/ murein hydrolase activator NlpD
VTRFDLLGEGWQLPPDKKEASYAPSFGAGLGKGPDGKDIKESSLPPVKKTASKALDDSPQSGPSPWHVKTADYESKTYGPSPWAWANGKESFPWPDPPEKTPKQKSSFQGHYTSKRSDTLAGIAERYKVSVSELKRVNGIPAGESRVKAGTVLAIPAPGVSPTAPPRVVQVKPVTAPPAPKLASVAPPPSLAPRSSLKKTVEEEPEEAPPETKKSPPVAKRAAPETRSETKEAAKDATKAVTFLWPVTGSRPRVISTFGPQADGTKNEGIKLAVPLGSDIQAADAGRVHYAGDGLKGYGNLVLIRHANGWVTTYAHASKMLVKVGDEVKRGQVIAKSGQTGPVDVPQLGFELRKGSMPVNPLEHLPK